MKAKVKKFFSEIFVKTYDYPFIIGFLEANGVYGIVPSLKKDGNKNCVNYEMFKKWWKQNCAQKQPKCDAARVNNGNCGVRSDSNQDSVNIEYIISHGDKSAVIDMAEVLDEFVKYNTKQAERFIFERPHFKDLEYFIRKHIVSDIL